MDTTNSYRSITGWRTVKYQNRMFSSLFSPTEVEYSQDDSVMEKKKRDNKVDSGNMSVALLGLIGGLCLIVFRKKISKDIINLSESWVNEPVSEQELTVKQAKVKIVKLCQRFFEIGILIFGTIVIAMALPTFIPFLHRPVSIFLFSFFFIFLPATFGSCVLTLVLWPVWGWKVRKYKKDNKYMSLLMRQHPSQQILHGNDNDILRKLQTEASKYGIMYSVIIFIILVLIDIKILLIFDLFNKLMESNGK